MLLKQDKVGRLNEMQETHLEIVQKNAIQLKELIDDILDVSIIESSSLDLSPVELDLREEIEAVVEYMQEQVAEREIYLAIEVPFDLPRVRADRLRLSQVMSNLLGNACKYSPLGTTTTIAARDKAGLVQIDVTDTGIGISGENLSRLFTKFFRVDNSLTREVSGTGPGTFHHKAYRRGPRRSDLGGERSGERQHLQLHPADGGRHT